ncbi:MAG: hypothetical protein JWO78_867 [Micavibrio sp.]|nr:hypothetical protein [Micavibrio sp.]
MGTTVTTLPETNETSLCLRLNGTVTAEDYLNYFDLPLRAIVTKNGFCKLCVIYADDFVNWSPEAADLSFKNISELAPKARKVAYVNPPDSRMLLMKMLDPVMDGKVRYFDAGQDAEALSWTIAD